MPLSDHEQRLLDDIEKALYAEDPKFASSVRSVEARRRRRPGRHRLAIAVVGVLAGLALVLLGLSVNPLFGLAGFVVIVAAVAYGVMVARSRSGVGAAGVAGPPGGAGRGPARPGSKSKANSTGIRARMEDRMRRRFEEN